MLKFFNTQTKQLEAFKPISKDSVSFYHCGPTVYWTQHIGNMRAMVMADIVYRTLQYLGYTTTMTRNYTDVGHLTGENEGDADQGEDKMEKAAKRDNLTPEQVAEKYIGEFDADLEKLNTLTPQHRPRATETIQEDIAMVQTLIDNGFAYSTDLAIYFDVSKAKDYTRLSGQDLDKNISGEGKGEVLDPGKKHASDFALWFFKAGTHKYALQTWPSPFISPLAENGEGFPGWHLECSVMAKKFLGDTIDIHMGGIEHIPVHHTNEIAQSESANGAPFVNYWLHNEHLLVEDSKMSKSEGTSYVLQDVIDKGYDPLILRYFFLGAHYRSKQNFTWEALDGARNAYNKLSDAIAEYPDVGRVVESFNKKFSAALEDDLNTPQALAVVWEVLKSDEDDADKKATLLKFDEVLGLSLSEIKKEELVIPQGIQVLLDKRNQARNDKDFELSDKIRDDIAKLGFAVKDTSDGQEVKKI